MLQSLHEGLLMWALHVSDNCGRLLKMQTCIKTAWICAKAMNVQEIARPVFEVQAALQAAAKTWHPSPLDFPNFIPKYLLMLRVRAWLLHLAALFLAATNDPSLDSEPWSSETRPQELCMCGHSIPGMVMLTSHGPTAGQA